MIEVNNVAKQFSSGDTHVKAVDDISFSIPTGSFAAIVGKSGSGKSTLLSLLGALDRVTKGSIMVEDQDITKLSDRKLIKYRREKIGFVFQHYNLIPNLSALENVMLPMEFAGVNGAKRRERATELLNQVGITADKQLRKPTRLSGGEQQRVTIARALANKPELILADEPTGNLDSNTSKLIVDLLQKLAKSQNTTIIVVTHDLNITNHTDMTFQLKDGKLLKRDGKIDSLVS
jgi:putative ABC transport system ATP-binding protein